MAVPLFRHHDAAQFWMTVEAHAEKVPHFALVVVRRGPDGSDAVDAGVNAFYRRDQAYTLFQSVRKDVIGHLKSWFAGIPVDTGDIFEEVITGSFYDLACSADFIADDGDRQFLAIIF